MTGTGKINIVRRLAGRFRKEYPYLKFSIRRKNLPTDFSLTGLSDGGFLIEIDRGVRDDVACFIMAHEIAHCLTYHQCPIDKPHDGPFWDAYKRTYEVYEKFCDDVNKG